MTKKEEDESMENFKLSDRIRIIDKDAPDEIYGITGTIIDIDNLCFPDGYLGIELDMCEWYFNHLKNLCVRPNQIELIEESEDFMKNAVFRVYDRVKHSKLGDGKIIKIVPGYVVEFDKKCDALNDENQLMCDGKSLTLSEEYKKEKVDRHKSHLDELFNNLTDLLKTIKEEVSNGNNI